MLKHILTVLLISIVVNTYSSPRVPSNYTFADIKLNITEGARKEIQADVDALHRSHTYLKRKIDKADLYFPIIERVFREENLPDDFKYLVIQESALIADAVSSSNAVGFWQFKKASAEEVGLRVDKFIDERMHITASSHAAAKYLKKNNFYFNNWMYALLAYNTGPGGAEKHVEKKYMGKKKMEISKKTHWYVKKFLAHKIAYENEIHRNYQSQTKLYEYENTKYKSLKEISDLFEIEHQIIVDHNKWLRKGRIPTEKVYLAIVPVSTNDYVAQNLLGSPTNEIQETQQKLRIIPHNDYKPISSYNFQVSEEFPRVNNNSPTKIKINGIPGFIAKSTDNLNSISVGHGITVNKFLKYNDMTASDEIISGQVYYLKQKKSKAKIHYHIVIPGENAWSISQKYGIKVKKLLSKNRMREEKDLSPGMVMWLRFIRPSDVPVEYKEVDAQNVIIKSIPNEVEYPKTIYPPIVRDVQEVNDTAIVEDTNSDFLFDDVDEQTDYIDENSYVDLEKREAEAMNISPLDTEVVKAEIVKNDELYHIVKSGETLFSVSKAYNVSIGQIRQWNNIDDLNVLTVGQRLLLIIPPENNAAQYIQNKSQSFETYRVRADDTLYGIARKYNISIKDLMDINEMTDFNIKEGQTIKIKPQN